MALSELVIRLAAKGGDDVKRELEKTKKALRETAGSADFLVDALEEINIGGKSLLDVYAGVTTRMGSFMAAIGPVGGAALGAAGAVMGLGAAIVGLTAEAYKFGFNSRQAGIEFESMQRRLEGLTGSADRARSILAMAKKEAGPSMFTTQQLEQASVMLAAYGMNVERTIPLITRLGQAFGADQEHMMMYARAFGQLAGGKMPEAEVMSQMGISKGELAQQGIKFDSQGALLSSAEETLTAFEKLVYKKFDGAYRASATTSEAMRASIQDSFEGIQRAFGMVVNDGMKPFEKAFGEMLGLISQSDFAKVVAMDMMRPLTLLSGALNDAQDSFALFVSGLAATVTIIPAMISRTIEAFQALQTGNLKQKALAILQLRSGLGGAFALAGKDFASRFKDYYTILKYQQPVNDVDTSQMTKPWGGPPKLPGDEKDKKHKEKVEKSLDRISNNTRKSADLLDLRNQTIGGGRLAGLGITGPEFAGMGMRVQSDFSRAKPISADTMVNRGIKTMIQNNLGFAVNGGRSMPVR
jgi:hypothetical protein